MKSSRSAVQKNFQAGKNYQLLVFQRNTSISVRREHLTFPTFRVPDLLHCIIYTSHFTDCTRYLHVYIIRQADAFRFCERRRFSRPECQRTWVIFWIINGFWGEKTLGYGSIQLLITWVISFHINKDETWSSLTLKLIVPSKKEVLSHFKNPYFLEPSN